MIMINLVGNACGDWLFRVLKVSTLVCLLVEIEYSAWFDTRLSLAMQ